MKLVSIIIASLICTAPALASEKKTVDLSANDLAVLNLALSQLDGYQKIIKDGMQEKAVQQPYDFGEGLRWVIEADIAAVRVELSPVQSASRKVLADEKDRMKAEAEVVSLGDARHSVQLITIARSELRLDRNPIPPSVLAGLAVILEPEPSVK